VRDSILEMANERNVNSLLGLIVQRLCEFSHVALARIWLYEKGDERSMSDVCPDKSDCLHLAASHGNPLETSEESSRWEVSHGRPKGWARGRNERAGGGA
jgi:hypothetical protein